MDGTGSSAVRGTPGCRSDQVGGRLVVHATVPVMSEPRRDRTARRLSLLASARDVFARGGYHAAKIDDIVAAAGVARGTFYLYFEDKRAIFEAIVDDAFARLAAAIVRVETAPADPALTVAAQVRANVVGIVSTLLDDRATTKILLSDAVGLDPAFDAKLLSFYEGVHALLEESLREGQSLGIVATGPGRDARVLAHLVLGGLKEFVYQEVMRGGVLGGPPASSEEPRRAPAAQAAQAARAKGSVEALADAVLAFLESGCLRLAPG